MLRYRTHRTQTASWQRTNICLQFLLIKKCVPLFVCRHLHLDLSQQVLRVLAVLNWGCTPSRRTSGLVKPAKAKFHYKNLSYACYRCRLSFNLPRLLINKGGCVTTLCTYLPSATSASWHFDNQCLINSFLQVIWLECESKVDRPDPCFSSCTAHTHVIKSISLFFHFFQLHSPHPRYKINIFIFYFFQLHSPHPRYKSIYLHVFPAAQIIHRVGQNHTYGVHTVFMAGKLPNKRSHTACIYGSGQPTHTPVRK